MCQEPNSNFVPKCTSGQLAAALDSVPVAHVRTSAEASLTVPQSRLQVPSGKLCCPSFSRAKGQDIDLKCSIA